jgi:hypothetical protein
MNSRPWSSLPHIWTSVGLPGFEVVTTYQGYRLEEMPAIPIELDTELEWLRRNGTSRPGLGLDQLDEYARPQPAATAIDLAHAAGVRLPASFCRFMTSSDLQSRVRSCTDCYLDPGQRVVETTGSHPGHLMHFLSDSQSCAHWYLHILASGDSAVLESDDLYCYSIENSDWIENPACRLERIDVTSLNFNFCAPSVDDFLFRFWIENEIWWAPDEGRTLSALELAYLGKPAAELN